MDNNSLVLVCSICDSVGFELSRVNKDSLSFKCTECGAFINIKNGLVGKYNIDKSKLKIVMPVRPVHDDIKPQKEWVSMSFRVTQGQRDVIKSAIDKYKKEYNFGGKIHNGTVLERMFADYLSGQDGYSKDIPDDAYTPDGINEIYGDKLNALLLLVVHENMNRLYESDKAKRDFILNITG